MIEKNFYCGVCYRHLPVPDGMTNNEGLDRHLIAEHGIDTYSENGKNSLAAEREKKFRR